MQKAFYLLVFMPVLLGILIATSIYMFNDMEQLKVDNQRLSSDLAQLRGNYEAIAQERDGLKANYAELSNKFETLQTAYVAENQARLKAEADAAIYKGMMVNMMEAAPATSPLAYKPAEKQTTNPEKIFLSGIVPVGTGSLAFLGMVSVFMVVKHHIQKNKKSGRHLVYLRDIR